MKSQVLVGAKEFMHALGEKSLAANNSLFVQAMTFEGDRAGEQLIDLMITSPAKDKRLIVDSFSKAVVSDHFVFGVKYLNDSVFRSEVKNTYSLIRKAEANGVKVKFVNPTGPMMLRYPLRNHKKLMVADGKFSFLGGINFSDHNFAWHDMMIELEDDLIGEAIKDDFLTTWSGQNQSTKIDLGTNQLFFLNGIKSKHLYEDFFDLVRGAKSQITVISPYVSEPLLPVLAQVAVSGVSVEIISPRENNKGLFHDYLLSQSSKGFFKLLHHPGMFHLKAMLIDNQKLVFGSSNYDLVSYHFEQEVVMVSEDTDLISSFNEQVLQPMKSASNPYLAKGISTSKAKLIMKLLKGFCRVASRTILQPKL